jgi:hypothetical protein
LSAASATLIDTSDAVHEDHDHRPDRAALERDRRGIIERAGWMGRDLPDDPHRASIVTGYVASGSLPCLHHVVDADPTLVEVDRALAPGRRAVRDVVGGPWAYSDEAATEEDGD